MCSVLISPSLPLSLSPLCFFHSSTLPSTGTCPAPSRAPRTKLPAARRGVRRGDAACRTYAWSPALLDQHPRPPRAREARTRRPRAVSDRRDPQRALHVGDWKSDCPIVKRTAEEAQLPVHLETDMHSVVPDLTGAIAEEPAAAATSDATAPVESRSATAPLWRARLELDESALVELPGQWADQEGVTPTHADHADAEQQQQQPPQQY